MAQKSSPVNLIIRDATGQQKMIKVVQGTPSSKQGSIQIPSGGTLKTFFKVPGKPETSSPSNNTVYRAVNVAGLKSGSKLVPVPMQAISQMQKVTVVNTSSASSGTAKKVQTQGVSGVTKLVNTVPPLVQQQHTLSKSPNTNNLQIPVASDSKTHISSILKHATRKRHDSENESVSEYSSKRRRAADKVGKGLRHFSMKVCEKVRRKGYTSYNEVADELVAEFTAGMHNTITNQKFDQKNIRRRVYDALNVLMAMNIISKEKKEIRWLGLPTNSMQECTTLEKEKQIKLDRIRQKTQQLHDLILQQISFKSLVERNRQAESRGLTPSPSSAIQLPFIVINTCEKALIDCSISNDKMEYVFNFNQRFQIHDDIDILKRMGLLLGLDKGECSEEDILKAKSMVPKALEHYIDQLGRKVDIKMDDILKASIKIEKELGDNLSPEGDDEIYSTNYSDDEDDDADSCSDVDVN